MALIQQLQQKSRKFKPRMDFQDFEVFHSISFNNFTVLTLFFCDEIYWFIFKTKFNLKINL